MTAGTVVTEVRIGFSVVGYPLTCDTYSYASFLRRKRKAPLPEGEGRKKY
ncbi:hypothetical protein CCP3SC1_1950004 [Gammaproteobacteria bacterium]